MMLTERDDGIHVLDREGLKTLCGLSAGEDLLERYGYVTCRKCKELVNKHRRGKGKDVPRVTLLNRILDCFTMVRQRQAGCCSIQNNSKGLAQTLHYMSSAEEMIKLLEGVDCGSWGGHENPNAGINNLFLRFEWLVYRHNVPLDLEKPEEYERVREHFVPR